VIAGVVLVSALVLLLKKKPKPGSVEESVGKESAGKESVDNLDLTSNAAPFGQIDQLGSSAPQGSVTAGQYSGQSPGQSQEQSDTGPLDDYIRTQIEAGFDEEEIRQALQNVGWDANLITAAFEKLRK